MANTVRIATEVSGVGKSSSDLDRLRDKFEKLQKQGAKGFAIGVGAAATTAGLNLVGNALSAVGDEYAEMSRAASDLNESQSKSRVVFGASAGEIERFGNTAADSLGLSKRAAIEASATFGNLFVGLDVGRDKAAGMSKDLVTLAGDLASFNNLDPTDVLEKLRSGLSGEAEPLRAVGVFLNEAKVKAKAMEMGLGDAHGELTDGEKVLARYKLIMEETTTAQGDFARTSDGVANSQRKANAELENMRAELGQSSQGLEVFATRMQIGLIDQIKRTVKPLSDLGDGARWAFGTVAEAISPADEGAQRLADSMADLSLEEEKAAKKAATVADAVKRAAEGMGDATDDFATRSKRNSTRVIRSLGDIADAFDDTWSELSGTVEQTAEDIFGPMERRAELSKNRLEQGEAEAVITAPGSTKAEIADAREELAGLQRDYFTLMAEMAGRGELTAGELSKLTQELKEELKTASQEEATSILNLIVLLDRLRAKGKGLFVTTPGNINIRSTGTGQAGQGGRASGGRVVSGSQGGPVVVGEKGPEVFVPDGSGTILPNAGSGSPIGMGTDPAILNALNLQTTYLARIAAGEPHVARPQTARGDLARQASLMPGGRL